jgi:benzoyl-CoA reductase subunit C
MSNSMAKVDEVFRDRSRRAKELKHEGKKVLGYLCTFAPVEFITAAGLIPYRMAGNMRQPVELADHHLETIACSFTRSVLDLALAGEYSFLDGFVIPHSCDNIVKLYGIWAQTVKHEYGHFLNVPHTTSKASLEFFEAELDSFRNSLQRYTGREITAEDLRGAITLHDKQRALVRQLYEFRKMDPPMISGTEITKVIGAITCLPVNEGNDLLESLISEVGDRHYVDKQVNTPRLMIYGTGNDDVPFVEMVEQSGARVVIDDLCNGTRPNFFDVGTAANPIAAIAKSYLEKINCPRTFRQSPGTHHEDLENRFGYLYRFVQDFKVDGVIMYVIMYCDTHAFDAPDVVEYLKSKNVPVLHLEEEYQTSAMGRLKTRIQAFLETIA